MPKKETRTVVVEHDHPALADKVHVVYKDNEGANPTNDVIHLVVGEYSEIIELNNHQFDTLVDLLLEVQMDIGLKKDSRNG
jgi:hypothetical protein